MENKFKGIVIDGNSLVYRMYYATEMQIDYYKKHNLPIANAIKLMLFIILKLIEKEDYKYALVAFDAHTKTLRHEEFAEYKAGRKHMPVELLEQLEPLKQAIRLLGIEVVEKNGIEADDFIGSFCKVMNKNEISVDVFTSDKDMLQLVNKITNVNLLKTGISNMTCVTVENFAENFFGLSPSQVTDFKGISGDSSDNLQGVKGIGPVTASKLILQYGSLEKIYENIDELKGSCKEKFVECEQHARLCKKLSTIDCTQYDNFNIDLLEKKHVNVFEFKNFLKKYHLNGFDDFKLLNVEEKSIFDFS